jgi:transcriptional regulator with XRE-family HTH domain
MTIEIANRLIEFRKKFGYSQEELANQLNVSRQSISNWESGEVTPSIDYLKALAKIYGVTMDELVSSDKPVDEVLKFHENKKEDKESENKTSEDSASSDKNKKSNDQVHIGKDGIHIHSEDGDNVDIDLTGIKINDQDISSMTCEHFDKSAESRMKKLSKYQKRRKLANKVEGYISGSFALIITVAYLILGFLVPNGWAVYWTLFLLIPVPGEFVASIIEGKVSRFPIVMVVCFAYLFGGMYANLWHPYWLEFLAIPVFYSVASPIDKAIISHRLDKEDDDSVITINGEDLKVHTSNNDLILDLNESMSDTESRITKLDALVTKAKADPKSYQDVKDDFSDEVDDIEDKLDEIDDKFDELDDEGLLTLDQKIEVRSKIRKLKDNLEQIKNKL